MTEPEPSYADKIEQRRAARMRAFDSWPPELRDLVNEYGFKIIDTMLQHKVTKPKAIRHIVETILDECVPTRGSRSAQGTQSRLEPSPSARKGEI